MRDLDKLIEQAYLDGSSLAEWIDLVEKINDGEEISKGKDPNAQSKVQKTQDNPDMSNPEDLGQDEGGEEGGGGGLEDPEQEQEEAPGGEVAPGPQGGEPPMQDPAQAPGAQIAIGNKVIQKEADPRPVRVKVSGEKQKLDLKPKIQVNANDTMMPNDTKY